MTKKLPLLIIAIIVTSFVSGSAFSYYGPKGPPLDRPWLDELNLTEEQKTKLDAIRDEHRAKMQDKRDQLRQARDKLHAALRSDASDEALRKQFKAMQELRYEFATARFEKILSIRHILTPEQRNQFDAMRKGRRPGRGRGPNPGY